MTVYNIYQDKNMLRQGYISLFSSTYNILWYSKLAQSQAAITHHSWVIKMGLHCI